MIQSQPNERMLIEVSDIDDFEALYYELRGAHGIDVDAIPAAAIPGEQGMTLDVLSIALSSGAVTALIKVLTTLIESRGHRFRMNIRYGKTRLELSADNAKDVLPALQKLFDE